MSELDLDNVVVMLMRRADPEGETFARLRKILESVRRGTFIGPASRRLIEEMVQAYDNIDCRHLRRDGSCGAPGRVGACPCVAAERRYNRCVGYDPARPTRARRAG